jgi:hypothetical protein
MAEAKKTLDAAEVATRKQLKASQKSGKSVTRFPPGMEWDVLHADSVILAGLVNALGLIIFLPYGHVTKLMEHPIVNHTWDTCSAFTH